MARNFPSRVPHVQPNSIVSAGNTSQSTRALESRTNYLKEIIDAIEAGRLLVLYDQHLSTSVSTGTAVFWNAETQQYEPAIAAVENNTETGTLQTLASSDCLGICVGKDTSTSGTIAILGMFQCPTSVLETLIDGEITPGRYYLSAASAGKLVKQRPPVTVFVANVLGPADACETDSYVLLNPQHQDFLEDHVHYQFQLVAQPAGTHVPPLSGEHHEITNPDETVRGWLPASHASFNGSAPTGAKFGYNLAAHEELNRVWPPIPAEAVVLEMFKPLLAGPPERFEGLERVSSDYVKIDNYGIWWMTSCYDQVPWETQLDTTSSASSSSSVSISSSSASDTESCPVDPAIRLILSFLKMTFATDKTVVTSLQPDTGQPLRYVDCDGNEASTGDLKSQIILAPTIDPTLIRGGLAIKNVADTGLMFKRGWITEGVIAGSDVVLLSGDHYELLDPTAAESESNPRIYQGLVTIDVQLDPTERELNPQIIKLGDAMEREYKNVTYVGFPYNRDSGINMKYNVPPAGLPVSPQLKIRAILFGRSAGPFSEMVMTYYRITRPTAGSPTLITGTQTTIAFDVVTPSDDYDGLGTDLPLDNAIEVESDPFDIASGDTVFVTLSRDATATPLYQNDIGVIRIGGIIVAG